jgi:hypothetical protein
MKYWIVQSKFVTKWILSVRGIVLYPFIFVDNKLDKKLINHELIHIEQIKDTGILKFYVLYLWYWYKAGFNYFNNPFEIEAFANDDNLNYIKTRGRKIWKF